MIEEFRNEPEVDFDDPAVTASFTSALDSVAVRLGRSYRLVIGGEEVTTGETFTSTSPSDPDVVVGVHARATHAHVADAIAAATAAFESWSRFPPVSAPIICSVSPTSCWNAVTN